MGHKSQRAGEDTQGSRIRAQRGFAPVWAFSVNNIRCCCGHMGPHLWDTAKLIMLWKMDFFGGGLVSFAPVWCPICDVLVYLSAWSVWCPSPMPMTPPSHLTPPPLVTPPSSVPHHLCTPPPAIVRSWMSVFSLCFCDLIILWFWLNVFSLL